MRTRAYLARRLDQADLDDGMTETYLVVWRRLSDLPSSTDAQLWWVLAIARRVAANIRRATRRRTALGTRLIQTFRIAAIQHEEPTDIVVATALAAVSPTDREVLVLHAWDDLGPDGIAGVLQISVPAAVKRLQRAKQRFALEYQQALSTSALVPDTIHSSGANRDTTVQTGDLV